MGGWTERHNRKEIKMKGYRESEMEIDWKRKTVMVRVGREGGTRRHERDEKVR